MLQNFKKMEGRLLVESKKLQNKSHSTEKNTSEKRRGSGRRCFCFERCSGVSSMFWTSVVQFDDLEQMNKKVDRSR